MAFLLAPPALSGAHEQLHDPPPELRDLERELERRTSGDELGCVSLVIIDNGRPVWERGFGATGPGRDVPATPDTVYPIASISKGLAGLAAAILVDEGSLDLDAPVSNVLTSFDLQTARWVTARPTVRDLMRMTCPIPHGGVSWLREAPASGASVSIGVVRRGAVVEADCSDAFSYSNYTAGVLGCVVNDVSTQTLSVFLREHVFAPLGMHATSDAPPTEDPNLVTVTSGSHTFEPAPLITPLAGQGFYSSARDLGRLVAAYLDPVAARSAGLDPALLESSRRPPPDGADPEAYWMGWGRFPGDGVTFELCNGQGFDCTSAIMLCPERAIGVVCLTDTLWDAEPGEQRVADAVAMSAMDALVGGCTDAYQRAFEAHVAEERRARESAPEIEPIELAGQWSGTLTLERRDHHATLIVDAQGAASLSFASIEGRADAMTQESGVVRARFRSDGEIEFLDEPSGLSGIAISLRARTPDYLVGSALVSAFDTDRAAVGSLGALLELHRSP